MYKLSKTDLEQRRAMQGDYPSESRWYAVMVHCGREEQVRGWLVDSFSSDLLEDLFLPVLQEPARGGVSSTTLLFHSYLFLRCQMNDRFYTEVCNSPLVYRILGRGFRIPSPLDDEEIGRLRLVLKSGCDPKMVNRSHIGKSVQIIRGPMEGVQGRVLSVNSQTVRLEMPFSFLDMGTSVAVVVPRRDVEIQEGSLSGPAGG